MNALCDGVTTSLGELLCQRIGAPRYDLWFRDKTKFEADDDRLIVGVANCFYQEWLQKKFTDELRALAEEVFGGPRDIAFVIDPQLFRTERQRQASDSGTTSPAGPTRESSPAAPATASRLRLPRRRRRLEDFVVGPCNRVAHAAALSVVEEPGEGPVPLVLHGPVGTGKSHLLEGIHGALRERLPEARVLLLTAEEFTNRFLASMHAQKQGSFRKQFRDCDVLLVDDLQFLAKKRATQEEFLHTLEVLQRDGRPVIVTCDCHPRLAEIFLPELTDRLGGGAVWGLTLPAMATRRALLAARTAGSEPWPAEVLDFLAEQLRGNARELEGAVHAIRHLARVTDRPLSLELAREATAEVLRSSVRVVQLADVERATLTALGLPTGTLQSRQRRWQVSAPRMLAMYLARKHTAATYGEVGHHFGRRNHSTVVAAEKKVRSWLDAREDLLMGTRKLPVADVLQRIEAELAR